MSGTESGRMNMTWPDVCARRLERHWLAIPSPAARPAEVVSAICGAHAQILSAAELSIGLRLASGTRQDVRDALWRDHSLIKTFGPRGTVHLLPAHDLVMWTGALSAIPPSPTGMPKEAAMTAEQTTEVVAAIDGILAEEELTVDELTEALVVALGSWAGDPVMPAFQEMWPRWRQATSTAAHRGALCFGPNRGRKVTYTSPRRWLPGFRPDDGPSALAELVRRYLHAYGPATPQHFAQWLAAPRGWASQLFGSLAGELEQVEVEGALAWVAAGDGERPAKAQESVHLLPYFDAYVVGSHPRERLYPGVAAGRALARGQAGNFPVLLVDGVVAGVWQQRRSGRNVNITVEPFNPLSPAHQCELDSQVERIGDILEGQPHLTIGPATAGPHA